MVGVVVPLKLTHFDSSYDGDSGLLSLRGSIEPGATVCLVGSTAPRFGDVNRNSVLHLFPSTMILPGR